MLSIAYKIPKLIFIQFINFNIEKNLKYFEPGPILPMKLKSIKFQIIKL